MWFSRLFESLKGQNDFHNNIFMLSWYLQQWCKSKKVDVTARALEWIKAPNSTVNHCIIDYHRLTVKIKKKKSFSLKNVLDEEVKSTHLLNSPCQLNILWQNEKIINISAANQSKIKAPCHWVACWYRHFHGIPFLLERKTAGRLNYSYPGLVSGRHLL